MERDPVRYVWKHSRSAHLAAFLVAALLLPLTWLWLDLPRIIIDDALMGSAFAGGRATAPFFALNLKLPPPFLDDPLPLTKGIALTREVYFFVACAALAVVALARAALLGAIGLWRGTLARRLAGRLRLTLFDRIVASRLAARDEAITAADLAGRGVARVGPFLGDALLVPVLAGSEIVLLVVFAFATHVWLGLAVIAGALMQTVAVPLAVEARRQRDHAHASREADVARAAQDVSRRLPAIRIHGTAETEARILATALAGLEGIWRGYGRRLVATRFLQGLLRDVAPAVVIVVGGYLTLRGQIGVGGAVAVLLACLMLPAPIDALVHWRRRRNEARGLFEEMARTVGAMQSRARRDGRRDELDRADGRLEAVDLAALDPASGVRIAGLDVRLDLPAQVALVGDSISGANVFAGLIGGGIEPSAGSLTLAGVDLARLDGASRAARIAFAGGAPTILDASLRENLLYGARSPTPIADAELVNALTVAGLDDEVYALGLSGTLGGARDPSLVSAIVEARRAVRVALTENGCADLVDPFDPASYNRHATLAENLMFGVPVGDTFREANLARHPFMRAVLEAEGLTAPFAAMGLSIARSMVEIFEGVPDGHPLFERFSFFGADERGAYEELVARQADRRRGNEAARDRDRLVALALRYVETRHRLGLIDGKLEQLVVTARRTFRILLPQSLSATVEFYDPDKLCVTASLADNILFGRVAQDVAEAEERVQNIVRQVLAERGLDHAVFAVGLETPVNNHEQGDFDGLGVAIDLARCLVRKPDVLVVTNALDGLGTAQARAIVARLRAEMAARSLFLALPDSEHAAGFDAVLTFERGVVVDAAGPRLAIPQVA